MAAVKSVCDSGKVCVLDIDVEGVKQVKKTDLNPLLVFIKPPSLADLETRLRGRNTETEDSLQRRLDAARKEMVYGKLKRHYSLTLRSPLASYNGSQKIRMDLDHNLG